MKKLTLIDGSGHVLAAAEGEAAVSLTYDREYQPGDALVYESDEAYVYASADAFLQNAYLYLPGGKLVYRVPTAADDLLAYHPLAFRGGTHTAFLGGASAVKDLRRDLALNPMARRAFDGAYPFASANVETRDEPVFFARNVIDGIHLNQSHGFWPWQSWGIGLSETAEIRIDFGREVEADSVRITLRADFPHDAYWKQVTLTLSDGTDLVCPLQKTAEGQVITFDQPRRISWIRMHSLVKQVCDSPFPALRCFEVFGRG